MLGTPKNGKARSIAIPRFLMPPIERQMDGMGDDDWLFRAASGGNLWTNTWRTRDMAKGRPTGRHGGRGRDHP